MSTTILTSYSRGVRRIGHILGKPSYALLTGALYPVVLWLFIYVTNLNVFTYIWSSPTLSTADKWEFLLGSLANVFIHFGDPLATSIIIFAALATINIVVFIYTLRKRQKSRMRGSSASAAALIGSHCVACGGSLIAPVITALSGSGAYISAARANTALVISLSINILAILLILHVTLKLASQLSDDTAVNTT